MAHNTNHFLSVIAQRLIQGQNNFFYISEFQYSDYDIFNDLLIGTTSHDQKPCKFQTTLIQQL